MLTKYRTEIKWGLIFVAMTLIWMLIERLVGLHDQHIDKHPIYTNLIAIPAIIIYVLGLREKKRDLEGQMSFYQGFVSGLIITVVVTVLVPITQAITSFIISPDYFNNAINYAVSNNKMTPENAAAFFNYKMYTVQGLIGAPAMGFLTTAIVAFFVKTKKK